MQLDIDNKEMKYQILIIENTSLHNIVTYTHKDRDAKFQDGHNYFTKKQNFMSIISISMI